jgi:hypothetical protein
MSALIKTQFVTPMLTINITHAWMIATRCIRGGVVVQTTVTKRGNHRRHSAILIMPTASLAARSQTLFAVRKKPATLAAGILSTLIGSAQLEDELRA